MWTKRQRWTKEQKRRWRKLQRQMVKRQRMVMARDREKLNEGRAAHYAMYPEKNIRNGINAYHKYGGAEAREKFMADRRRLVEVAEQAGCKIHGVKMRQDKMEKSIAYFEKLIEKRDIIKKSGSASHSGNLGEK